MTNNLYGADALNALTAEVGGGSDNEFTSFKSGTSFNVKVLGTADLMAFDSYGIFKQVNSFVAENPSTKSKAGYPVDNLTPWDKAWKYHKDLSNEFSDQHGQEASKYRAKRRFAMGFFDLTEGKEIVVDVSKAQAAAIHEAIVKYEKRLGKLAFELSKSGSGTSTKVSLTPIIDMEEDLTDKERENFANAPETFDQKYFEGILYEMSEKEQIEKLQQAGFDVSLIGLTPQADTQEDANNNITVPGDDDLPF